jgi:uncharacterized phiE125 gp8 family phage protein
MYKVTTAPAAEPVTLTDVKNHLKVDTSDDDDLIGVMIQAAREYVETYTGRAVMEQTIEERVDYFPAVTYTNPRGGIELRFAPLKTLTHLKYKDSDGTEQTLAANTDYVLDNISEPPRIFPAYGVSWPISRDEPNAVWFEYVAGYTTASDVPASIKQAIFLIVGKMYEQREDSVKNLPTASKWLLDTVKIQHL